MLNVSDVMLTGQKALVTGAGQGIGEGIALTLANFGADVAALDINESKAQATAEKVRELGRSAFSAGVDVRDSSALEAGLEAAASEIGDIDIIVNNAGSAIRRPSISYSEEQFDEQVSLNLKPVFITSRWAATRWIESGRPGNIVNVATTEGIRGCPGFAPYSAAKAGMINLTKTLSSELGPYGIRVNAIAPDYTPTPGLDEIDLSGRTPGQRMENIIKFIPLRRLGSPDDMAGAVLFLVSELSAWVSGQTLTVDGGSLACARVEGPMPFPNLVKRLKEK
ncbi:SDR family oxidoreductase [Myxococcota bacterium]|nr:SDR family oxidoreductase [Myxococcota bacterium]